MRKCCLLLCGLLISLLFFVGCSQENSISTGTLELNIDSATAKGLQAISMEVSAYTVEVKNADEESVWSNADSVGLKTKYSIEITAGSYTVEVQATNKAGQVIGNGSTSVEIQAGRKSSCSVSVKEVQGSGSFQISISGPEGYTVGYSFTNTKDEKVTGNLNYSEASGTYTATVELANGFYEFCISVSGFEKPIKTDAVRIIANQAVQYSTQFSSDGNGQLVILNEITATPSVYITLSSDRVAEDGSLTVLSSVEGLTGTISSKWIVDEVELESHSNATGFELSMDEYSLGEHTITLIVSSGDIIWSDSKTFTVYDSTYSGHYVGSRSDGGWWYFFEVEGGEMTYSYYDEGRLVQYEAVPYTTKESEDGTFLIFKVSSRTYDYALFLPEDSADYATGTLLYYEYGVDENSESVDRYVRINLEKKQKAVSWTVAGYISVSESRHASLLQSEYVTVRTDNWEAHSLNENGVCSACGYDGHDFDIMDDASKVLSDSGYLDLSRYWPGEFTLSDGTVVNDGNKFFVQRTSDQDYTLFYPATIYDAYEAGGGRASISSALEWYLSTYYDSFEYNSFYNIEDVKAFFENLFALDWVEPSSDDVSSQSGRREVLSDTSKINSEATSYSFTNYNQNTLSIDGNAITEQNGIYFVNSDNRVIIYFPMIISEMYEKAKGDYPDSGNPEHVYINIYFPDLDKSHENTVEMVKTLVNGYVEPKLEDFIEWVEENQ